MRIASHQWNVLLTSIACAVTLCALTAELDADEADSTTGLEAVCQNFGTAVLWTNDVKAAQQRARCDSKLLFVMHLSGNFTKSTFT
jgi:hypothetical protein